MRNESIYFRLDESKIIKEFRFEQMKKYPNIPSHIFFWDEAGENPSRVGKFLKEQVFQSSWLEDKISSKEMYLLVPDDTQMLEMRALEEFFMLSAKPKKLVTAYECQHLSVDKVSYISIAETCRMLVLTYIKDGGIKNQSFLERKVYETEELRRNIRNLGVEFGIENVPIYLNGEGLNKYNGLGTMVPHEKLLDNFTVRTS